MPASPESSSIAAPGTEAAQGWSDALLIGLPAIDHEHETLIGLVSALVRSSDARVAGHLTRLSEHLELHFASEERLIAEYEFGPGACHVEEHDRVRASLVEVRALVADGDFEVARDLGRALADWLPAHIETMDSSLSTWVTRRRQGGAPVILRRSMASGHAGSRPNI